MFELLGKKELLNEILASNDRVRSEYENYYNIQGLFLSIAKNRSEARRRRAETDKEAEDCEILDVKFGQSLFYNIYKLYRRRAEANKEIEDYEILEWNLMLCCLW